MFIARQVASQVIHSLPSLIAALAKHDRDLADQLRRAGASILLNIVEGNRRVGRDRLHFFRIAAGSAAEVDAALEVAIAFRYLDTASVATTRSLLDRQLALLWGLTHKRA
jgi:four helix bundle protein